MMVFFNFHLDINECVVRTDGCDHNCTNTDGSYYCTCMDGYELESDNHTCAGQNYMYANWNFKGHSILYIG